MHPRLAPQLLICSSGLPPSFFAKAAPEMTVIPGVVSPTLATVRVKMEAVRAAEARAAFAETAGLLREAAALVREKDKDFAERLLHRAEEADLQAAWHESIAAVLASGRKLATTSTAGAVELSSTEGPALVANAAGGPRRLTWNDITADGVRVKNVRLLPSVTGVLIGIDVNAAVVDTLLEDIEVLPGEDGGGVDEFALAIDIKAGCSRTQVLRAKVRQHASAAGCLAGVRLTPQPLHLLQAQEQRLAVVLEPAHVVHDDALQTRQPVADAGDLVDRVAGQHVVQIGRAPLGQKVDHGDEMRGIVP